MSYYGYQLKQQCYVPPGVKYSSCVTRCPKPPAMKWTTPCTTKCTEPCIAKKLPEPCATTCVKTRVVRCPLPCTPTCPEPCAAKCVTPCATGYLEPCAVPSPSSARDRNPQKSPVTLSDRIFTIKSV
uniref:Uncharacterized protein n=1 Tax=Crocodylus porosus TaxID=8502 RepID=A0A7M4F4W7_CROPO